MGIYADTLADLNAHKVKAQYEFDIAEGTNSTTINVFSKDAATGDNPIHSWTGTGGMRQMAADWRSANPSVTSGEMFDCWQSITTANQSDIDSQIALLQQNLTYLTRKIAHYQAIVDNGEDPNGLSLEDMADIEALAP